MAREIGKVNVSDLAENNYKVLGIGINKSSNSNGIFSVNYITLSQAQDNLKNLILTRKGERVGQPEFGCDIWKVLFDPIVDGDIDTLIEDYIVEAVNIWLPYIEITELIVDLDDELKDLNQINVEIHFCLKDNPTLKESIKIEINN